MSAATASHHPPPPLVDQPPLKQQRTGAFDPFAQAQYSAFHAPMLQPPPQQPQMQTPNGMYSPPGTMQMWPPGASPQPLQQLSPYPMQSSPHMMQQQYQQYLQPFPPSFGHFPPQQQMPGFSSDGNGGGMHFLQSPPGGMMNGPGMPLQMQMQNGDFVNMVPMQLMQQMNGGATAEQQQQQHQQQIQQQIQQQQQQQQQAPQPSGRNSMNFSCHQW
jgi:hypothetical protein